jgi:hypothetical protein
MFGNILGSIKALRIWNNEDKTGVAYYEAPWGGEEKLIAIHSESGAFNALEGLC